MLPYGISDFKQIRAGGLYYIDNLNRLFIQSQLKKYSIYVLIDEYDNFINELLVKDEAEYRRMVTGQEAKYKQFFRTLKAGTSGTDGRMVRRLPV